MSDIQQNDLIESVSLNDSAVVAPEETVEKTIAPESQPLNPKTVSQEEKIISVASNVLRADTTLGLLMGLGASVMPDSQLDPPEYYTREDRASIALYNQHGSFTNLSRFDAFYLDSAVAAYGGGITNSRLRTLYHDRLRLIPSHNKPISTVGAGVMSALAKLNDDATAMRNLTANPQARSGALMTIVARSTLGRAVADETAWALRLIAASYHCISAIPVTSPSLFRLYSFRAQPISNPSISHALYSFPANTIPNIPCYYANANQFARFLRGEAPAHGILQSDLEHNWSVIPVSNSDYGDHLLMLAVTSMSSELWTFGMGMFSLDCELGNDGANDHFHRQYCRATALSTQIDGPTSGVIFLLLDEAGPSTPTPPRNFWDDDAVPCLIEADPAQQDVNILTTFIQLCGNSVGGQPDEPETFESAWLDAWKWFCNSVITPGAERQAYDLAAEFFHRAELHPDPTIAPENNNVNILEPQVRQAGLAARRRRNVHPRNVVINQQVHVANHDPDAELYDEEQIAQFEPVVDGWVPSFLDDAGALLYPAIPSNQPVPQPVEPYVIRLQGTYQVQLNASQLCTCSPSLSTYGLRSSGLSLRTSYPPLPANFPSQNHDFWRRVSIPDYQHAVGVERGKVASPDNLARIVTYIGTLEVGQAYYENWVLAKAMHDHIQKIACTAGALASSTLIGRGLSLPVMLGLNQPTPKRQLDKDDFFYYDLIKYALLGSVSIQSTSQSYGNAASSDLRNYPTHLRRDGLLYRYKSLPLPYREMVVEINNLSGQSTLPLHVTEFRPTDVRIAHASYRGWADPRPVKDYIVYNLAAATLDITGQMGWPSIWMSNANDELRLDELTAFFPDANRDRMMWAAERGQTWAEPVDLLMNNFCFTHQVSEQPAFNIPDVCLVNRPYTVPGSGQLVSVCQWPPPGWLRVNELESAAKRWTSSKKSFSYFGGGESGRLLESGRILHNVSPIGVAVVERLRLLPEG